MTKEVQKKPSQQVKLTTQQMIENWAKQEGIPATGITLMGGKPYINVTGLDVKLKQKCETESLVQVKCEAKRIIDPTKENNFLCGYHADIVLLDRDGYTASLKVVKPSTVEMLRELKESFTYTFSAEGWASPLTCEGIGYKYRWKGGFKEKGEMLIENVIMMAERRATNRAKREATGTGLTSLDELPLENIPPESETPVSEGENHVAEPNKKGSVLDGFPTPAQRLMRTDEFREWCKVWGVPNYKDAVTLVELFHEETDHSKITREMIEDWMDRIESDEQEKLKGEKKNDTGQGKNSP